MSILRADDGVALWYQGVGQGPPAAFCHGGPGIADYLEPVQQMVADSVTVYRWDQRGSGRSDTSGPFTIARFGADLEALRTHLGHEQWTLLRHSWGANLAIHYAQEHARGGSAGSSTCAAPGWSGPGTSSRTSRNNAAA